MRIHRHLFICLFVLIIFFLPFLLAPQILTTRDNDLGRTYISLFNFFKQSLNTHQQIPLWRPQQLAGETFIGNPLSSLLYPGNLIFLFFDVHLGSIIYLFAHFLIAAFGMYYLARSIGFSGPSSLATALFYALSTKMIVHLEAGHLTMIAAMAYFPISFLALRHLIQKFKFSWLILGSLALSFSFITYPTIFYYTVIFLAVWSFYYFLMTVRLKIDFQKHLLKSFSGLFLLIITMLGLSSIVIFPQLEFAPLSTRSQLTLTDVAIPLWNLERFLKSLFFPYQDLTVFDHESFLYLGVVPIILAILGFLKLPIKGKFFLGIVGLAALVFVAGTSTPLFELAYDYLPGLKYSRVTTRLWFIVAAVVALLSGFVLGKVKKYYFIYIVIAFYLIEIFYLTHKRIMAVPNLEFTNFPLYEYLKKDQDFFRVYCTTYCFNPQLISQYQTQTLHGETPIQHTQTVDFLKLAGGYQYSRFAVIFPPYQVWQTPEPPTPDAHLLGAANVKYIASTYELDNTNFQPIPQFDEIYLYQNRQFKPRVYLEQSNKPAQILDYSPNRIKIEIPSNQDPQTLVISEIYYPGWFAYVNNQKFAVEPAWPIFRKVTVPGYSTTLELRYQPTSFTQGKTITIGTIVFLILIYLHTKQKRVIGYQKH